jgi:hypothetical protein
VVDEYLNIKQNKCLHFCSNRIIIKFMSIQEEVFIIEKICLLRSENNKCPFFDKDKRCTAENTNCGMLIKMDYRTEEKDGYVRKKRWYEQYSK